MEDKEIGELWAKHKLPVVEQLIRKLVFERELLRIATGKSSIGGSQSDTLQDFGIDPKEFTDHPSPRLQVTNG